MGRASGLDPLGLDTPPPHERAQDEKRLDLPVRGQGEPLRGSLGPSRRPDVDRNPDTAFPCRRVALHEAGMGDLRVASPEHDEIGPAQLAEGGGEQAESGEGVERGGLSHRSCRIDDTSQQGGKARGLPLGFDRAQGESVDEGKACGAENRRGGLRRFIERRGASVHEGDCHVLACAWAPEGPAASITPPTPASVISRSTAAAAATSSR